MKDTALRGRFNSALSLEPSYPAQPISPTRMSILPAVLRRREDTPPPHQKTPLLTVSLSSNTFLDAIVEEDNSKDTLYQIKTVGTSTTVSRMDRREGSVTAASIKWPRMLPLKTKGKEYSDGVLIQMRGSRWNGGETLLRPAANNSSTRKFSIPDYPHPMKWKPYGNTYWCTTPSVKGPIAILDMARGQDPTRLSVYETLHDKYDPKALSAFQGVSVLLLDYILVTALLLVTDLQEWMLVRKFEGNHLTILSAGSSVQGPSSALDMPPASDSQWRKIMYGEPIFPKLSGDVRPKNSRTSLSTSPTTPALPRTPSSPGAPLPGFSFVEFDDPSSRPSSRKTNAPSLVDDDDDDDDDVFPLEDTDILSPSAESVHLTGLAPSHTYIDPSFYGSPNRPPVPPSPTHVPPQYARSLNGRNFSSQPSTPLSATFVSPRDVPMPQTPLSPGRPRSSPPLEFSQNDAQSTSGRRSSRSDSIRSSTSFVSQSGTSRRRPLPRPPPVPPLDPAQPLTPVTAVRRVQSSNQLLNKMSFARDTPPRPQRSLPPTPYDADSGPMPPVVGAHDYDYSRPPSHSRSHSLAEEEEAYAAEPSDVTVDATLLRASDAEHPRRPPITKASQEDLTQWVHMLTSPQRDLPVSPLPSSSIYDVPPPAYSTINFSRANSQNRPPVPVAYPRVDGV